MTPEAMREAAERPAHVGAPDDVRRAATALVEKLDLIHADPRYESVWTIHQLHAGPYAGPSYAVELAALRAALSSATGEGACRLERDSIDLETKDATA